MQHKQYKGASAVDHSPLLKASCFFITLTLVTWFGSACHVIHKTVVKQYSNIQEAQLLLGDRATRKHAKDS